MAYRFRNGPDAHGWHSWCLLDLRHHVAALMPLLILATLVGSTFWLVERYRSDASEWLPAPKRHVPSYFVEGFSASMLTANGTTRNRLRAERVVQYEDDETLEISHPTARTFQPGKPFVTVRAERGVMSPDNTIIDLFGKVRVDRMAAGAPDPQPPMRLETEKMRLLLNDDLMITDQPVMLERGASYLVADGMRFNNVTREVQLLGSVRGTILSSSAVSP